MTNRAEVGVLRFDGFELDISSGELRTDGTLASLQPQPFKVLALLAGHSGQAVSREEIRRQLWGNETFVDFEASTNFCIRQIRKVLGDDARRPRYIETLHRRGYRFKAPLDRMDDATGAFVGPAITSVQPVIRKSRTITLAVLPFSDLGCSAQTNLLADGITDLLITHLSTSSSLRVVSRTTSMRYKHTTKSLPRIGKELGVDRVLEGTVLHSGVRVRVTVRLIDPLTDRNEWGSCYELHTQDDLELQDQIVRAMVRDTAVHLNSRLIEKAVPPAGLAENNVANQKGRYYLNQKTEKNIYKAIECFKLAIAQAPDNAPAYADLARAYTVLGYYGSFSPREIYSRAKVATQKTLHLDPALADAHATRAYGMMLYEWDWVAAERGFKKAIEFDPLSVAAHQWYADFLTSMKRHDEAIEQIQLARELDPLSLQINTDVAWVLLHANHYDQAIAQYRQVLEMDEDFGLAHWGLGLAYERSGMFPEAFNSLEKASRITERTPAIVAALGHAYATSGRKSEGPKVLSKLREIATHRYVPAYDMATISFALGDFGQTISWLGRACRERSAYLVNLAVDSRFEKLRRMQSVQDVARQVGLATSQ